MNHGRGEIRMYGSMEVYFPSFLGSGVFETGCKTSGIKKSCNGYYIWDMTLGTHWRWRKGDMCVSVIPVIVVRGCFKIQYLH